MVVWGISDESAATVAPYAESLGLTYPILLDQGGAVNTQYAQSRAFPTAVYPQDWVIGTDGLVVYANNHFELGEITAALDRELE